MKVKNRELGMFGMSLLDVLSGALGAFLFLSLALMDEMSRMTINPEQSKELKEEREKLKEENKKLDEENSSLRSINLMMTYREDGPDVDLWLKEPDGDWDGPKVEYRKGVRSSYQSMDARVPEEFEAFTIRNPSDGEYLICYRVQSNSQPAVTPLLHGFLFANLGMDYQTSWRLGSRHVSDLGVTHVWMKFEIKDHKLVHIQLENDEIAAIEARLNSEGDGPPELLETPEQEAARVKRAEDRKRAAEERETKRKEREALRKKELSRPNGSPADRPDGEPETDRDERKKPEAQSDTKSRSNSWWQGW